MKIEGTMFIEKNMATVGLSDPDENAKHGKGGTDRRIRVTHEKI
jgi:hypothetical protein